MTPKPIFTAVLRGEVPSKKNRYRISGRGMYQDHGVTDWMDSAGWQLKEQVMHTWNPVRDIAHNLLVEVDFYITRAKDIDNMLNSVFDLLQYVHVIENDNQIGKVVAAKFLRPKEAPYCEVRAYRIL